MKGTGATDGRSLLALVGNVEVGGVLTVDLSFCCSGPSGCIPAGSQLNRFVLDRRNGTLANLNDDPVPMPNVFHKISR